MSSDTHNIYNTCGPTCIMYWFGSKLGKVPTLKHLNIEPECHNNKIFLWDTNEASLLVQHALSPNNGTLEP